MSRKSYDERNEIKRNEDGTIISRKLDPETARRMAEKRWKVQQNLADDDITALLLEGGWEPESAPTVAKVLAEQIAGRGARSVQAVREYLRLIKPETTEPNLQVELRPNTLCPTCGSHIFAQDVEMNSQISRAIVQVFNDAGIFAELAEAKREENS